MPSVPKKLDHNELGMCESVPESVLASVLGSGGTSKRRGSGAVNQ